MTKQLIPKYSIWENVIIESVNRVVTFWKIIYIRVYQNPDKIVYAIEWWLSYEESDIKLAILEAKNSLSKFHNIYPFI